MIRMPNGRNHVVGPDIAREIMSSVPSPAMTPEAINDAGVRYMQSRANDFTASTPAQINERESFRSSMSGRPYIGMNGNTPEGMAAMRGIDTSRSAAQRAGDRRAGLAEGRRNRAIARFGLTHLQPTNNYLYGPQPGGFTRTEQTSRFGSPSVGQPKTSLGQREAAFTASLSAPAIQGLVNDHGFDPVGSSPLDLVSAFNDAQGNWSDTELNDFRKYIASRSEYDQEFRQQWEDFANQEEYSPRFSFSDPDGSQDFQMMNDFRTSIGLKPVRRV